MLPGVNTRVSPRNTNSSYAKVPLGRGRPEATTPSLARTTGPTQRTTPAQPFPRIQRRMNPLHKWASNTRPQHPTRTLGYVVLKPPKGYIFPFSVQPGVRTVKVLILAAPIHDQKVTMVQPGRVSFTIRTRPRFPPEKRRKSNAHRNDEFGFPSSPE